MTRYTKGLTRLPVAKMAIVIAPNPPEEYHLPWVETNFKTLGVPEIRMLYDDHDRHWYALEGSHRLAIASKHHFPVIGIPMHEDDLFYDIWMDGEMTAGEALDIFAGWGLRTAYKVPLIIKDWED